MHITAQQAAQLYIHHFLQVVQALGASETDLFKLFFGGAAQAVDGDGAINVVNAATALGVTQYIMVTSMGTGKWGWPAGNVSLAAWLYTMHSLSEQK